MMLADHGAEVIRIERKGRPATPRDVLARSRRTIHVDLKTEQGVALVRRLAAGADAIFEGFRPGVMERLGLGPDTLLADNPRLVFGRMTGWGQDGPYANMAGHDINYIALSGALHAIGRKGAKPVPPLNLVGDFGGGGLMLAFAMVSAMLHARETGTGQVVDCAMAEGSAVLMAMLYSLLDEGRWRDARGTNLIDGAAHFYDSYETADGRYIALGAVEPQFYAQLLRLLDLSDDPAFAVQLDPARWPALKQRLAALIATRTRDEWCALFDGTDVCFAPVMAMGEAPAHPHNQARGSFVTVEGVVQPAPAPRYAATPNATPRRPETGEAVTAAVLAEAGYSSAEVAALRDAGAIA